MIGIVIGLKLLPKIETLCEKEDDNGVKKKYLDAIKKVKKYKNFKKLFRDWDERRSLEYKVIITKTT